MATEKEAPLGSIENPIKFRDQDYKTLLEECLKIGKLFADPAFPAEQKSVGMPEDPDPKKAIKWQRPKVHACYYELTHRQSHNMKCITALSFAFSENCVELIVLHQFVAQV